MNSCDDDADRARISDELKSFEAELAHLRPCGDRLDRDRVVFLAGRASLEADLEFLKTTRTPTLWQKARPAVFAATLGIAATVLAMTLARPRMIVLPEDNLVASQDPVPRNRTACGWSNLDSSILSTADAHRREIDDLLSTAKLDSPDTTRTTTVGDGNEPLLTPAHWRLIIDRSEAGIGSRNNSFRVHSIREVTS
jgi:hypothetical protein